MACCNGIVVDIDTGRQFGVDVIIVEGRRPSERQAEICIERRGTPKCAPPTLGLDQTQMVAAVASASVDSRRIRLLVSVQANGQGHVLPYQTGSSSG